MWEGGGSFLTEVAFVTQLSSSAGILFRRLVWVTTNCLSLNDMSLCMLPDDDFVALKIDLVNDYFYLEGLTRSADRSLYILSVYVTIYSVIYILSNLFSMPQRLPYLMLF